MRYKQVQVGVTDEISPFDGVLYVRTINALERAGIRTVESILAIQSFGELFRIRSLGKILCLDVIYVFKMLSTKGLTIHFLTKIVSTD